MAATEQEPRRQGREGIDENGSDVWFHPDALTDDKDDWSAIYAALGRPRPGVETRRAEATGEE